ncbi:MAG TPA: radical SAM protein [Pseudomonadota bacterium]|nr:radical SAM protein [Pseudomonadota bacterium]
MRVLLISANREQLPSTVVPLGVLYVAAALRPQHQVSVLDLCFEKDEAAAITAAISRHRPDLIGIGIRNLHDNAYRADDEILAYYERLVAAVRQYSSSPIVLGGAGFSLRPHDLMRRLQADFGVVGAGEDCVPYLVSELAAGRQPAPLLDARMLFPVPPPTLYTLDRLPLPDRRFVDPRYYELDGTDNIQTKRGCSFRCAYCDYPDLEGQRLQLRSPDAVADEVLQRAQAPDVSFLFFVDSVFNVPQKHALAICEALIDRGSPIPWVAYVSPVQLDRELVSAMAKAGCVGVEIGSDTGTEDGLHRLRKPFKLTDIQRSHELLRSYGIHDCHTFVVGAFGETADQVKQTLDFVAQLDPDVAVFIVFHEDREALIPHAATHRQAILALLAKEAALHPGWVVPELNLRLSSKLLQFLRTHKLRGPSWLHLARLRAPGAQLRPSA